MHLVSNDSRKEDNSESEPILSLSNILQYSEEESPSSGETKSLGRGCDVHVAESESTSIDEICHLVNPDRPQRRICLDIGGLSYLLCSVLFYLAPQVLSSSFDMVDFCLFLKNRIVLECKSFVCVNWCFLSFSIICLFF